MATYLVPPVRIQVPAGADLSGSLYRLVSLNSSGQAVLPSGLGADCIGVLDDLGLGGGVSGSNVTVIIDGGAKLEANAAIAIGADIMAGAATGRGATAATSGSRRIAKCWEAAANLGDVVSVIVNRDGQIP